MIHSPMTAAQVLDREFLELRAKVLEVAASFDRMQRAAQEDVAGDPRMQKLIQAMQVAANATSEHRAEQIQQIFSRPYDPDWRQAFQLT